MTHFDCPIITARTDKLGPSASWIAGVNEGGVALQALDPLSCFTVPHPYSLICAC